MKTVGSRIDPTALSPYDQTFAGQLYDADAQCAELYNSSSYMCRVSIKCSDTFWLFCERKKNTY